MAPMKWKNLQMACVVLAAAGYPDAPVKDAPIEGDLGYQGASSYFLHAGTAKKDGQWVTNGGRVLNAIGMGSSRAEALREAYAQAKHASWRGLQMRKDIGAKAR
jgi:phosphoribosylamine--glycine ligase